jgi:lipoprotein-anchoring transpeptidase ErfK/SrfK
MRSVQYSRLAGSAIAVTLLMTASVSAEPLALNDPFPFPRSLFQQVAPEQDQVQPDANVADEPTTVPDRFRRQVVAYDGREAPGTVIVDTPHTYLYYVLGQGRAIRYGIGVGRDGFTWSGVQSVARKQEWPDWHPPEAMIARQPYLPRFMAGGPSNPLGARAMYLGNTEYRIHGTNAPDTIGKHVSSGCIRLTNDDVIDLFNRVNIGAKVIVLPDSHYHAAAVQPPSAHYAPVRHRSAQVAHPAITIATSRRQSEAPRAVASIDDQNRQLMFGSSASRLY